MSPRSRREFITQSGFTAGLLPAVQAFNAQAKPVPLLTEHGFWDYVTPTAGGMEAFRREDYLSLLDDMARCGMNSLVIFVKWLTTGYRSRLPFLDQLPGCPVIASDNALLRDVIKEARDRSIKVWLGAVVTNFDVAKFGLKPYRTVDMNRRAKLPMTVGVYDSDVPELAERATQIFEELVELFPGIGGLIVELEGAGVEGPHRIPLYEAWARENGRPPFQQLGHPLDPRVFDIPAWRDYTTHSRLKILKGVEKAVRAKRFSGDLAMICETDKSAYATGQEINLKEYHRQMPDWSAITYEYQKSNRRYAMMDVCVDQPKREGLKVYYLPRGVMTWGGVGWPLPIALEENWRRDVDDIRMFKPDGVWWFGCGTVNNGTHVSLSRLKKLGYANGAEARRALIQIVSHLSTH